MTKVDGTNLNAKLAIKGRQKQKKPNSALYRRFIKAKRQQPDLYGAKPKECHSASEKVVITNDSAGSKKANEQFEKHYGLFVKGSISHNIIGSIPRVQSAYVRFLMDHGHLQKDDYLSSAEQSTLFNLDSESGGEFNELRVNQALDELFDKGSIYSFIRVPRFTRKDEKAIDFAVQNNDSRYVFFLQVKSSIERLNNEFLKKDKLITKKGKIIFPINATGKSISSMKELFSYLAQNKYSLSQKLLKILIFNKFDSLDSYPKFPALIDHLSKEDLSKFHFRRFANAISKFTKSLKVKNIKPMDDGLVEVEFKKNKVKFQLQNSYLKDDYNHKPVDGVIQINMRGLSSAELKSLMNEAVRNPAEFMKDRDKQLQQIFTQTLNAPGELDTAKLIDAKANMQAFDENVAKTLSPENFEIYCRKRLEYAAKLLERERVIKKSSYVFNGTLHLETFYGLRLKINSVIDKEPGDYDIKAPFREVNPRGKALVGLVKEINDFVREKNLRFKYKKIYKHQNVDWSANSFKPSVLPKTPQSQ